MVILRSDKILDILKAELTGLLDTLGLKCKRKREIKNVSKALSEQPEGWSIY